MQDSDSYSYLNESSNKENWQEYLSVDNNSFAI